MISCFQDVYDRFVGSKARVVRIRPWATVSVHCQTKASSLALDEPTGKTSLPDQLLDNATPPMKPAMIVGTHVSLMLRQAVI